MFTYLECYSANDLSFFVNNYSIKNKEEYRHLKKVLKKYDSKHNTHIYREMKMKMCKDRREKKKYKYSDEQVEFNKVDEQQSKLSTQCISQSNEELNIHASINQSNENNSIGQSNEELNIHASINQSNENNSIGQSNEELNANITTLEIEENREYKPNESVNNTKENKGYNKYYITKDLSLLNKLSTYKNYKRITEIYLCDNKNNFIINNKEIIRIKYNDNKKIARIELLELCCNNMNYKKCNKYCSCGCTDNINNNKNNNIEIEECKCKLNNNKCTSDINNKNNNKNNNNINNKNNKNNNNNNNYIILPKNKIKYIFNRNISQYIISGNKDTYNKIYNIIKDNELCTYSKIKYKRIKILKRNNMNKEENTIINNKDNILYYDIKIESNGEYKKIIDIIIKSKEYMNYDRINILSYFTTKSKEYKNKDSKINTKHNTNNRNERVITIPIRVEPKVFFANERTFLSWLQFAIFNGTIGVCMFCLSAGGVVSNAGEVCGFILIVVSVIFCIYALYLYFYRAGLIRRRNVNYDNLYGPVVLTVVFISAMVFCVLYTLERTN